MPTGLSEGEGFLVLGLSARSRPRIIWREGKYLFVTLVPWDPDSKTSYWIAVTTYLLGKFKMDKDNVRGPLQEERDLVRKKQAKRQRRER